MVDRFSGRGEAGAPVPLPPAMAGKESGPEDAGVVPGANVQANGVAVGVGLYPIVTSQHSSTTLYQVSYHIQ